MSNFDRNAEGLRGLAALNVAIFHYLFLFFPDVIAKNIPVQHTLSEHASPMLELLRFPFFNVFYNGHFAVVVFFVLSGYVLTLPAYTGNHQAILRRYWGRFLRLGLPAFASVFIAWVLYRSIGINSIGLAQVSREALEGFFDVEALERFGFGAMLYEGAYLAMFDAHSKLNLPLWSIGAEFILSLLLLTFFLSPNRVKWIYVGLTFLFAALLYSNSVTYLIAMFLGAHIVRLKLSQSMVVGCGLFGIYLGGYQIDSIYYDYLNAEAWMPSTKKSITMFGALFLTTAVINGFGKILTCQPMAQLLGRFSFSIYILHMPILLVFATLTYQYTPNFMFYSGGHLALFLALTFVASWFFERYVDKPSIQISKQASAAAIRFLERKKVPNPKRLKT